MRSLCSQFFNPHFLSRPHLVEQQEEEEEEARSKRSKKQSFLEKNKWPQKKVYSILHTLGLVGCFHSSGVVEHAISIFDL